MRHLRIVAMSSSVALLNACAVVAVVDTAGTVAAKTVGLAADAAVGTVKIVGAGVGKVADATLGGGKNDR
jgi:hypothetical protein